jgi:hypothetical protein
VPMTVCPFHAAQNQIAMTQCDGCHTDCDCLSCEDGGCPTHPEIGYDNHRQLHSSDAACPRQDVFGRDAFAADLSDYDYGPVRVDQCWALKHHQFETLN